MLLFECGFCPKHIGKCDIFAGFWHWAFILAEGALRCKVAGIEDAEAEAALMVFKKLVLSRHEFRCEGFGHRVGHGRGHGC